MLIAIDRSHSEEAAQQRHPAQVIVEPAGSELTDVRHGHIHAVSAELQARGQAGSNDLDLWLRLVEATRHARNMTTVANVRAAALPLPPGPSIAAAVREATEALQNRIQRKRLAVRELELRQKVSELQDETCGLAADLAEIAGDMMEVAAPVA